MLTLFFTGLVMTLATWSLVGLYFDSVLFDAIRSKAKTWKQSQNPWKKRIGYALECPLCLSHWVAGCVLVFLLLIPYFEFFLLLFIVPRLAVTLRDNLFWPMTELWNANPAEIGNERGLVVEKQTGPDVGPNLDPESRITRRVIRADKNSGIEPDDRPHEPPTSPVETAPGNGPVASDGDEHCDKVSAS